MQSHLRHDGGVGGGGGNQSNEVRSKLTKASIRREQGDTAKRERERERTNEKKAKESRWGLVAWRRNQRKGVNPSDGMRF